ncbi:MAG TPA: replication factor C large subunit, partial [Candidatus Nanoarchaeia archaeon]|nr:replication factor C large subunit [Candidatus Nanoarchaeia archaeon]
MIDGLNWAEKYRVKSFEDFKGQESSLNEINKFLQNFPKEKKAILIHGSAGVGKTSIAHVIKNELDVEIFELNASDFRNKEQLEVKLKPASEQKSLFKKNKILLVDEVDGLSTSDRGGLPELINLIKESQFPIFITANNIWDAKFGDLRKVCKLVGFNELDYKTISLILQDIARKEHLSIDNQLIISISVRCKGDVRAAINDLQTLAFSHDPVGDYILLDERDKENDIFNALKFIFKNMPTNSSLGVYNSVNMPLDKIFLWVEHNIPYEYSGEELYKAYESLSIADVFRGRVMRMRHYRFLVYQNAFLSYGISNSKKSAKMGFTKYQKPTRVLKIWMNNEQNKHKKSIISKYASATHCSVYKAAKEFNFIKNILKNQK